jgi:sensor histidine kinase YesM
MIADGENYRLVYSLIVLNRNGSIYAFSRDGSLPMAPGLTFDTLKARLDFSGEYAWTDQFSGSDLYLTGDRPLITIVTTIRRFGNLHSIQLLTLDKKYLMEQLADFQLPGQTFLYDVKNGHWIAPDGFDGALLDQREVKDLIAHTAAGGTDSGAKWLIASSHMQVNGWNLISLSSSRELSQKVSVMDSSLVMMLVLSVLAAGLASFYIGKTITRPLKKLTDLMASMDDSNLTRRFTPRYSDEVGVLAGAFDRMMDKIVDLTERICVEQTQKKLTYLKLLQMQIKPHFLYNALETTRFLVEMHDERASEMVQAISAFYKLSLSNMSETAALGEELEQLRAYLKIMSMRYSSRLNYEIEAESDVLGVDIIKFSLQPVAENAIYHGIKQVRRPGLVRVRAFQRDELVIVEVYDNGAGMDEAALMRLRQHLAQPEHLEAGKSIGLANVHQRIRLYCGEAYGIAIESRAGEYTLVTMTLPRKPHIEREAEEDV